MAKYEVHADFEVVFIVDTDENRVLSARVIDTVPYYREGTQIQYPCAVWRVHPDKPPAEEFEELDPADSPTEIEWARRVVNECDEWPPLEDWR